ncbi:MAG: hypothetical protein DRJ01_01890 [Bacteroidetes bacterium]|nr:MAG: hypothetical protein DRJ01_01890 [Bacteroidota bacterium]
MKTTVIKLSLVFILFVFINNAFSQQRPYQNPKFGKDSASRVECAKNISLYTEFYKQKNYNDALNPWRYVFNNAPKASKNTYIKGAIMYKCLIRNEKNLELKNKYIDTLMMIYDQRIEHFNQKGSVLGRKGVDLYNLSKDREEEAYKYLLESLTIRKEKTDPIAINSLMQATYYLFKKGTIAKEDVINNYTKSIDALNYAIKNQKKPKKIEKAKTIMGNCEGLFSDSGAADCDALISLFTPKFNEAPEDVELLKKITKLLDKTECNNCKLFEETSVNLYKLEPSAQAAYNLSKLFLKKEKFSKATHYYKEAISLEEDSIVKARYYYELGILTNSQGNHELARTYAYNAIKFNPKDGNPYILIGKAYATDSKNIGEDEFAHKAVYWSAVDKFIKAKKIDTSLVDQANELIKTYSQYFPDKESAFFHEVQEGNTYTVEGWINEKTIARFK